MGYQCRIGVSPAGVVWVAYKPQNVEPMRRKLTELWQQHEAKKQQTEEENSILFGDVKTEQPHFVRALPP